MENKIEEFKLNIHGNDDEVVVDMDGRNIDIAQGLFNVLIEKKEFLGVMKTALAAFESYQKQKVEKEKSKK